MEKKHQVTVINAHQRSYDDPLVLVAGEHVEITKQDVWDDKYLWLWCIGATGKEGWTPAAFLDVQDNDAIARCDYNALELTVAVGEELTLLQGESGWYWAEKQNGEQGWVPVNCCQVKN